MIYLKKTEDTVTTTPLAFPPFFSHVPHFKKHEYDEDDAIPPPRRPKASNPTGRASPVASGIVLTGGGPEAVADVAAAEAEARVRAAIAATTALHASMTDADGGASSDDGSVDADSPGVSTAVPPDANDGKRESGSVGDGVDGAAADKKRPVLREDATRKRKWFTGSPPGAGITLGSEGGSRTRDVLDGGAAVVAGGAATAGVGKIGATASAQSGASSSPTAPSTAAATTRRGSKGATPERTDGAAHRQGLKNAQQRDVDGAARRPGGGEVSAAGKEQGTSARARFRQRDELPAEGPRLSRDANTWGGGSRASSASPAATLLRRRIHTPLHSPSTAAASGVAVKATPQASVGAVTDARVINSRSGSSNSSGTVPDVFGRRRTGSDSSGSRFGVSRAGPGGFFRVFGGGGGRDGQDDVATVGGGEGRGTTTGAAAAAGATEGVGSGGGRGGGAMAAAGPRRREWEGLGGGWEQPLPRWGEGEEEDGGDGSALCRRCVSSHLLSCSCAESPPRFALLCYGVLCCIVLPFSEL